jgi:hypothetical protein
MRWVFQTSKPIRLLAFAVLGAGLFLSLVLLVFTLLILVVGLTGAESDGIRWGAVFVISIAPFAALTLSIISFILFWIILGFGHTLKRKMVNENGKGESSFDY